MKVFNLYYNFQIFLVKSPVNFLICSIQSFRILLSLGLWWSGWMMWRCSIINSPGELALLWPDRFNVSCTPDFKCLLTYVCVLESLCLARRSSAFFTMQKHSWIPWQGLQQLDPHWVSAKLLLSLLSDSCLWLKWDSNNVYCLCNL